MMVTLRQTTLLITLSVLLPALAWAEAPVDEASPAGSYSNSASSTDGAYYGANSADPEVPLSQDIQDTVSSRPFTSNSPASILSKINELQTEIQRLRGQSEIQAHEIKQLKEQQQAYYNDLDQRIGMLSGNKTAVKSLELSDSPEDSSAISAEISPATTTTLPIESLNSETTDYNTAYALVEKKQFALAIEAMTSFLRKYPDGQYASNAHYWLGELYLAQHQEKKAVEEFNTVVTIYPDSSKVSAAMLKLGFAYANAGDTKKAKETLYKVQKMYPGTTTAQLAQQRLLTLK